MTADGLTVDGTIALATTGNKIDIAGLYEIGRNVSGNVENFEAEIHASDSNNRSLHFTNYAGGKNLSIHPSTGDISFYEDTGTTAKMFWDASAESLGIGTSSVVSSASLTTQAQSSAELSGMAMKDEAGASTSYVFVGGSAHSISAYRGHLNVYADNELKMYTNASSTPKVVVDTSGNVGIGTSSPANQLDVVSSTNATARIEGGANGDASLKLTESGISGFQLKYDGSDNNLYVGGGTSGSFTTHMAVNRDSGNVGIGTSSPASLLHVQRNGTAVSSGLDSQTAATFQSTGASGSSTHVNILAGSTGSSGQAVLTFGDADDPDIGRITYRNGDNSMAFMTNASEAMRIDSSGRVGIGTTSPAYRLGVKTTATNIANFDTTGTTAGLITFSDANTAASNTVRLGSVGNNLVFYTNTTGAGSERVRIDASGNLLVGKTVNSIDTVGGLLRANGQIGGCADGTYAGVFSRNTSDGDITLFRKDGSTVGSIGTHTITSSSRLYVGSGDVNLMFRPDIEVIQPASDTGLRDAAISLGNASGRFKDLYLSGGAYLGGSAAANKLDDYEEGSFTPVIADVSSGGNTGTATTVTGRYTKVGNLVTVQVILINVDTTGMTSGNNFIIRNMPFASAVGNNAVGATQLGNITFDNCVNAFFGANRSYAYFRNNLTNSAGSNITVSDLTSGSADLYFTISYEAA